MPHPSDEYDQEEAAKRRDDALRRALTMPPAPRKTLGGKKRLTDADQKKKPGGLPAKKARPETK
jgi:hypothetical protein